MKTVHYEVRDGVAYLTISRPDAANSLDGEMARDLMEASLLVSENPLVRAVLLTGKGKVFCAGGDLNLFAANTEKLSYLVKEITTFLHAAVSRFTRMAPPIVAAVNGAAAGAGMSLACACDFVVAAESAKFTMAYTKIGLTPDGSSTYFLPRLIGLKRALELSLTNRTLSAQEALQWGLVSRVVPDSELLPASEALAKQLAAGPTLAFKETKRLLHLSGTESLETQMEQETIGIAGIVKTADAKEGIASFLEKRAAKFQGK
jgi:2-(1,2-epoxy-1,2-dihydrophenyl)acetyl-CoA isomerase